MRSTRRAPMTYSRKRKLPINFHQDADTDDAAPSSPPKLPIPRQISQSIQAIRPICDYSSSSSSPQPEPQSQRPAHLQALSNEVLNQRSQNLPTPPPSSSPLSKAKPTTTNLPSQKPTPQKPQPTKPNKKDKQNSRAQPRLTQLTIDLGGDPHKKCKQCGMEYVVTNAEDAALHKRFHKESLRGLEVPGGVREKGRVLWSSFGGSGRKMVVEIDRRDGVSVRRFGEKVLRVAERELGAVAIASEVLWGTVMREPKHQAHQPQAQAQAHTEVSPSAPSNGEKSGVSEGFGSDTRERRKLDVDESKRPEMGMSRDANDGVSGAEVYKHKLYLFIQNNTCTGLCLAEQVHTAKIVLPPSTTFLSSPSTNKPLPTSYTLGISRIWTSHTHRRTGIAKTLVDTARQHFLAGVVIRSGDVAFSQPTEMGWGFARGYVCGGGGGGGKGKGGKEGEGTGEGGVIGGGDGCWVYDEQGW